MRDRCQLDPPNSVRKAIDHVSADLHREAGLTSTTDTSQRHQPMAEEQIRNVRQLDLATDERRQRCRQVRRGVLQTSQRRELLRQSVVRQLKHSFAAPQVTEPHLPEIDHRDPVGQTVGTEICRGTRHQNLATVSECTQPSATNHRLPEVVALVAQLRFPGVHRHPDPKDVAKFVDQRLLSIHRSQQRVGRPAERSDDGVTFPLLNGSDPSRSSDGIVEYLVVPSHRRRHRGRVPIPACGGTLNIGEQEGDRPGRKVERSIDAHGQQASHVAILRSVGPVNITRLGDQPHLKPYFEVLRTRIGLFAPDFQSSQPSSMSNSAKRFSSL